MWLDLSVKEMFIYKQFNFPRITRDHDTAMLTFLM